MKIRGWTIAAAIITIALLGSNTAIKQTPYVLAYPASFGNRINIPEDNPLTKEGVALGRSLFYETKLSAGNKISCSSCHLQQLAFTDGKPRSTGVDGVAGERNSMSLANLLWVRNFFWDGRMPSLEDQAIFPLTASHEMAQSMEVSAAKLKATTQYPAMFQAAFGSPEIDEKTITKALAQFERTLISADSRYDQYINGTYTPDSAERHGLKLFMTAPVPERNIRGANCAHCHGGPKFFLELFHNNGLDSIPVDAGREKHTGMLADKGRFRVPTLRNIAVTAPYMHDGRFNTLEEVLDHYSEHIQESATLSPVLRQTSNTSGSHSLRLTATEKKDIIAFLHLLTDSSFLTNPAFSNPNN
ncbi:cytochrome-c peroxidase [Chitinophaga sp. sic0106]|uniref:cytochrome-c peroxidase n=1 Tax=Chitinophaga sp. sic0106 TaxID=2854785 RepID=UPI001C4870A3|nr:cytochrome c peroxidase [Chitinophaga sp. sic0106]MBV7530511.1 cytochrome-c peroxidase [Chitinophaga sp. sic0106]